jgi:hypothetical protein
MRLDQTFVRCIVKLNNVAFAMFGRKRVEGHMYTCTKNHGPKRSAVGSKATSFRRNDTNGW